jgi:CRP/FNR family transcriptional regulator, cyclic AMP receptor protein
LTGFEPLVVRPSWNEASDRDWADALSALPLFTGFGKRDLRRIAREAEFAEFAAGDTVVSTGAPSDFFYVILSGEASASAKPAARPLSTGDYFGEMGLLGGEPRSASVVATTELHVMRLSRRAFDELLDRHPAVARTFLDELGGRVRQLEHQRHVSRART